MTPRAVAHVRVTLLYLALVLVVVGVFASRAWAHDDFELGWHGERGPTTEIVVGPLGFAELHGGDVRAADLRELHGLGVGFERQGLATLVSAIVAAFAIALIGELERRRARAFGLRLAFAIASVPAFVMALVFSGALAHLGYAIGRAPYLIVIGVVLAWGVLLWPARAPKAQAASK